MESYLDAFDYFRMEPERFFEAEDGRIVVFIRSPGRGKGSGEISTDRAEALEAVGLSEQDARRP